MRVLCLLFALCFIISSGHAKDEQYFDVTLVTSIADPDMDYWFAIPLNSGPFIPKVKKVYRYQTFQLLMFCRALPVEAQKTMDIEFDIKIVSPKNKVVINEKGLPYYSGKPRNALVLPENVIDVMFEESEEFGVYKISVTLREKVSKREFFTACEIELIPFERPEAFKSQEEYSAWMMNYHRKPEPMRCLAGILQYIEAEEGQLEEDNVAIAFTCRILKDNPFIWEYYSELYSSVSREEKKRLSYVAAFADSEEKRKIFEPNIYGLQRPFYRSAQKLSLPSTEQELVSGVQLDCLWANFFASGKYQPIRRLVDALALGKYKGAMEKIKNKEITELTEEVEKKVMLESVYGSAIWSLIANGKEHPLVYKYCITIYEKETLEKEIKDDLGIILYAIGKELEEGKEGVGSKYDLYKELDK